MLLPPTASALYVQALTKLTKTPEGEEAMTAEYGGGSSFPPPPSPASSPLGESSRPLVVCSSTVSLGKPAAEREEEVESREAY